MFIDGNTTRRAFDDPEFLSDLTGVPLELIVDLWDLHVGTIHILRKHKTLLDFQIFVKTKEFCF